MRGGGSDIGPHRLPSPLRKGARFSLESIRKVVVVVVVVVVDYLLLLLPTTTTTYYYCYLKPPFRTCESELHTFEKMCIRSRIVFDW